MPPAAWLFAVVDCLCFIQADHFCVSCNANPLPLFWNSLFKTSFLGLWSNCVHKALCEGHDDRINCFVSSHPIAFGDEPEPQSSYPVLSFHQSLRTLRILGFGLGSSLTPIGCMWIITAILVMHSAMFLANHAVIQDSIRGKNFKKESQVYFHTDHPSNCLAGAFCNFTIIPSVSGYAVIRLLGTTEACYKTSIEGKTQWFFFSLLRSNCLSQQQANSELVKSCWDPKC